MMDKSDISLKALKEMAEAATGGIRRWSINETCREVRFEAGQWIVMDFVRYGMQNATPRFFEKGIMHNAAEFATSRLERALNRELEAM